MALGLDPDQMTDTGMWIWAAGITIGSLILSYFIAIAWQRWKDQRAAERP